MEDQRQLILKSFLVESEEGLAQMEQCVLQLESHPNDADLIQTVFRVVHTAKGNAGILELQQLQKFAHTLEDLLDALRKNVFGVTTEITNILLAALDVLREMTAAAGKGKDEISSEGSRVLARIADCLKNGGKVKKTKSAGKAKRGKRGVQEAPTTEPAPEVARSAVETPEVPFTPEISHTLRVDMEKLDKLLNLVGEISIARGHVTQMLETSGPKNIEEIREAHRFAEMLHLELQETILKTRMVPLGPLFRQFSRTVRDLSKSHGKVAQLNIQGEEVEVDTSVVEHLKDPLLHMVRNAIDHGIELPNVREECGKPACGNLTLRAAHENGNIVIELTDDGRGLDRKKIMQVAAKRGLVSESQALPDEDIYQLIFEPGFSTASEITDLSGRGVGLDVVRRNVQALRGSVGITSSAGKGSSIQVRLPLTLAIIEGFGVSVAGETFVIPMDQVTECVELPESERAAEKKEGILQLRDEPLPYLCLKDHFELSGDRAERQNIVIVRHDFGRAGLAVDVLHGATQTVIKPLPPMFKNVAGVSGSAILGNGTVALILDVPALLRDFRMSKNEANKVLPSTK